MVVKNMYQKDRLSTKTLIPFPLVSQEPMQSLHFEHSPWGWGMLGVLSCNLRVKVEGQGENKGKTI